MFPKCFLVLFFLGVVFTTPSIAQNEPKLPSEESENFRPPVKVLMVEEKALENTAEPRCSHKHNPPTEAPLPSPKHHHHDHHKPPTEAPSPSPKHHHHRHNPPTEAPSPLREHHHHPHQEPPIEAPKIEQEAFDSTVVKPKCPPKPKPPTEAPSPRPHHRKVSPSPAPAEDSEQSIMDLQ